MLIYYNLQKVHNPHYSTIDEIKVCETYYILSQNIC